MKIIILLLSVVVSCVTVAESVRLPFPLNMLPGKLLPGQQQGMCGGPLTGPSGNLASPYYPDNYPNNAYCVWTITVPQGSQLRIDFLFFETESCRDYVKIFAGRRLLHRVSGKGVDTDEKYLKKIDDDKDDEFDDDDDDECDEDDRDDRDEREDGYDDKRSFGKLSYGNRRRREANVVSIQGTAEPIRIVFRSDPWVTRRGFFAHYTVGQAAICGGPLTGVSGNFTSPGFPANYPNDARCRWSITVPRGSTLMLNFITFETERCHDYVEIVQGWRVLQRMSGVYYRYGWINDEDDDDDDDCDDDDDEDDDDDDDKDDRDDHKKKKYRTGGFFGFPYLYIPGTGEEIVIIFKSDRIITRQGFNVMYRVLQGGLFG